LTLSRRRVRRAVKWVDTGVVNPSIIDVVGESAKYTIALVMEESGIEK
jgi:hypothetical protein